MVLQIHVSMEIFIDLIALAKKGDNVLGSVRPCVCPFACALMAEPFDL